MKLHPNRHCAHKYMGDPKDFPCCGGRGWTIIARPGTEDDYIPDAIEVYCECAAGEKRREFEADPRRATQAMIPIAFLVVDINRQP